MTTKLKMLPVRVSPALRALIDQAGPVNAATRALIILGAEAAGLDLDGMDREVAGLLVEDLALEVFDKLRPLLVQPEAGIPQTINNASIESTGQCSAQPDQSIMHSDDPFAVIGVEV